MFRITRKLLYPFANFENFNVEKKHLLSLIENQFIGINVQIANTNCNIEKFLLKNELDELNTIKNKINTNILTQDEIKIKREEFSEKYTTYLNKVNKS
jgi:hypothetical protein